MSSSSVSRPAGAAAERMEGASRGGNGGGCQLPSARTLAEPCSGTTAAASAAAAAASAAAPAAALVAFHPELEAASACAAPVLAQSVPRLLLQAASMAADMQRLHDDLGSARAEVEEASRQKAALEEEVKQAKACGRQQAQRSGEEVARLTARLHAAELTTQEQQRLISHHRSEGEALLSHQEASEPRLAAQVQQLRAALSSAESQCQRLQSQLGTQSSLVEALDSELASLRQQHAQLRTSIKRNEDVARQHQEQVGARLACAQGLLQAAEKAVAERDAARHALRVCEERVQELCGERVQLAASEHSAREALVAAKAELAGARAGAESELEKRVALAGAVARGEALLRQSMDVVRRQAASMAASSAAAAAAADAAMAAAAAGAADAATAAATAAADAADAADAAAVAVASGKRRCSAGGSGAHADSVQATASACGPVPPHSSTPPGNSLVSQPRHEEPCAKRQRTSASGSAVLPEAGAAEQECKEHAGQAQLKESGGVLPEARSTPLRDTAPVRAANQHAAGGAQAAGAAAELAAPAAASGQGGGGDDGAAAAGTVAAGASDGGAGVAARQGTASPVPTASAAAPRPPNASKDASKTSALGSIFTALHEDSDDDSSCPSGGA
ncbi:hypothetical protein FOA52_006401 [Chlamydomonas sp. UWO 241]|nr:hypothetical protein FOA52_006401 [Chlamydomonas sp. UWO 241]